MSARTLLAPDRAGSLSLGSSTQFSDSGIVSRTLLDAERARVVLFGFAAGQELTEHASPARAIIQMLSGHAEWTLGTEKLTLAAGDLLHLPPGQPHAVIATEPFSMLLTLVRENAVATPQGEGLE